MECGGKTLEEFERLAAKAESALGSGDWDTAAAGFEALLKVRPEHVELKYKLARAYEELGRLPAAVELLNDSLVVRLPQAKRRLATIYMKLKNYSAALPLVEELMAASPTDPKLNKWKAVCDAKISNRRIEKWMQQGDALVSSNQLEEAEQVYLELLSEYPNVARAHLRLGKTYMLQGRWADAVASLQAGLEIEPGNIKVKTTLARALFKHGRTAEAIEILEGETDRDALFLLQRCHMALGDLVRADEVRVRLLGSLTTDGK